MKTWTKQINYRTIVNYYQKKWFTIKPWIDTLVYDLALTEWQQIQFKKDFSIFSTNSQDAYFHLPNYPGLDFKTTATHYKHWLALNISFSSFDTPTVECMQFFVNKETQKLTLYGLFFRFCELAKMDRQQFMVDISDKVGYQPKDRLIRGDYKVDILWITPDELLYKLKRNHRDTEKRISASYHKKWNLETIYLWNKTSKYAFPRLLARKALHAWRKQVFYQEYLNQATTRIEIQTGSNFIWDMNTQQRLDKVQSYIWDKTKTFNGNYYVGKRYNKHFILNTDTFQTRLENALLKATHNWINLQKTFDSVNQKQKYYSFTFTSQKWLSFYHNNKVLLKKEKPLLYPRQ